MQLIGMLDSPYVRRVAIALIMSKTPFIHRPISLFRHIDQFSKLNPLLKAPTLLTDDGVALVDFNVILGLAEFDPRIATLTPATGALDGSRRCSDRRSLTVIEEAVRRRLWRQYCARLKRHRAIRSTGSSAS